MRRSAKLTSGVLLTAMTLIGMLQATASPRVHRFLAYYEAVQKTAGQKSEDQLGFWERIAASVMLTSAEARESKMQATCSRTSSL